MDRQTIIRRASWTGIVGNVLLSALKVVAGWLGSSLALVGDGIDSLTDVVTSLVTLYAARYSAAPPDKDHPWGHGRAETIATKILSFVIFYAGLQLVVQSVGKLFSPADPVLPSVWVLPVVGISIVGKIVLTLVKKRAGRRAESRMLLADAVNMRNDVVLSLGVLAGLGFTILLKMPVLDALTGLLVGLWILRSAYVIFVDANTELMDSLDDHEAYNRVFRAAEEVPGVLNPHRVRIRKLNNEYVVDIDIEVDGRMTVAASHDIAVQVERRIRETLPEVYDIMVHVEPQGNVEDEGYGLSRDVLKERS